MAGLENKRAIEDCRDIAMSAFTIKVDAPAHTDTRYSDLRNPN